MKSKITRRLAGYFALVLLAFSVVFYGLWGLPFLILLAVILGMNYAFALALAAPEPEQKQDAAPAENAEGDDEKACLCGSRKQAGCRFHLSRKGLLVLALVLNLLPLLWFKYSAFLAQNLGALLHAQWHFTPPGLPLGISFYTFIQIAWLVSVYRGQVTPQALRAMRCSPHVFPM